MSREFPSRLFLILLVFCGCLYPLNAFARDGASAKLNAIHVVDLQRVISESVIGKAARSDMQEKVRKQQLRLQKQREEIKALQEELSKTAAVLSASALGKKREQLREKQIDFKRAAEDRQEELARDNQTELRSVLTKIREEIQALAVEENLEVVLEGDGRWVLYVDEDYDLTDRVIERLNRGVTG